MQKYFLISLLMLLGVIGISGAFSVVYSSTGLVIGESNNTTSSHIAPLGLTDTMVYLLLNNSEKNTTFVLTNPQGSTNTFNVMNTTRYIISQSYFQISGIYILHSNAENSIVSFELMNLSTTPVGLLQNSTYEEIENLQHVNLTTINTIYNSQNVIATYILNLDNKTNHTASNVSLLMNRSNSISFNLNAVNDIVLNLNNIVNILANSTLTNSINMQNAIGMVNGNVIFLSANTYNSIGVTDNAIIRVSNNVNKLSSNVLIDTVLIIIIFVLLIAFMVYIFRPSKG